MFFIKVLRLNFCVNMLLIASLLAIANISSTYAEVLESWTSINSHPIDATNHSCVVYSDYIYCVDEVTGLTFLNDVYYASVGGGVLGTGTGRNAYPISIEGPSCVIYSGYI